MRWGQRWPERIPRPKARRLTEAEKVAILADVGKGHCKHRRCCRPSASRYESNVAVSTSNGNGRMKIPNPTRRSGAESRRWPVPRRNCCWKRERRKGSWSEVARGAAGKLIKVIASDTRGTFHGLGSLDKSLRKSGNGLERLPVKKLGKATFVYADTGKGCTVQEALFHYFGLPVEVVAEPAVWYGYHRTPRIVEASKDRTRVLVRFTAESMSGETFGGTCLYAFPGRTVGGLHDQAQREQDHRPGRGVVSETELAGVVIGPTGS